MSAVFLNCCEFAWQLRITHLIRVEVRDAYTHSVFYVECTDIVQKRSPALVFCQVLGHVMGEKDVPGVSAIHYRLRHVDASTTHVGASVHVAPATVGATLNAHPTLQPRIA